MNTRIVTQNMVFVSTMFVISLTSYLLGPGRVLLKILVVSLFLPYVKLSVFLIIQIIQIGIDFDVWYSVHTAFSNHPDYTLDSAILALSLNYLLAPAVISYVFRKAGFYRVVNERLGLTVNTKQLRISKTEI